ncbi:MAG TPA: SUMF1/EgtB/PvdO family nonheme iron enzyme [Pyrinomonadaceae bacterium]|nr:SUMF1/EgtB/PvdO family nonheme iron enzyme [Pyrinomonadaceae bacterium]
MKECPACRRCFPDEINHCPQDGDATTPSLLGETILDARYQLEKRLGQGGMGVVFQARHIFLKTSHAIKVILPDLVGNDPMLVTRFRQEALAAAAIRHQNIIAVTDFGVVRGTMPFLVMEFVNGKSLQDILAEEKKMSPARALEFICAVGAGVSAAHRQNIVHRDLKPLNIMAQEGMSISEGLKILDFGLAKIKSGELLGSFVQAKTSGLMGSPFYMAPEQWSDEEPDSRADVYSLGIIFYQMLSGDVPFKGTSIPSIMKKHLTLPVPSFKSVGVDVSPKVEAAVFHALEKEVEARTPTVEAFLTELRAAVEAGGTTMQSVRNTIAGQLGDTLFQPSPSTNPPGTQTATPFDSMAGTVSSASLSAEEQAKLAASRAQHEFEQQERDRIAREELEREAEARRKAVKEAEQKRKAEEERLAQEKAEREERDRQQREQIERVERQAKELEDRLARLATSMPPSASGTMIDPESTQIHQGLKTATIPRESLSGVAPAVPDPAVSMGASIAPPKPRSKAPILMGVVLLILLAGGAAAFFIFKKSGGTGNGGDPTPRPSAEANAAKLIQIPGGTFKMGRNNGPADLSEAPEHVVTVKPFFMDRTEVTNAEYAEFVRETNRPWPEHWASPKAPAGEELIPVSNVTFDDAVDFAAWRSKRDGVTYRLPTEEEWEYAARNGERSDLYPWGNSWLANRAVLNEPTAAPVGSRPDGKNQWGVEDLIGNVWEWTSSKLTAYPGSLGTIPPDRSDWITFRGAGYPMNPTDKEYPVSSCVRSARAGNFKARQLGFRLVRSA